MKKERITITKEWLQSRGITNVTEDGRVFKGDKELKIYSAPCKHKYGKDRGYPVITIYDPETYQRQKKEGKLAIGQRMLLLSRVVYAWYSEDRICPGNLDVDHIDTNPFNNHKDNLRLLTRKENRTRSLPSNQRLCKLTKVELENYFYYKKKWKSEIKYYKELSKSLKQEIKDKKADYLSARENWHSLCSRYKKFLQFWSNKMKGE